MQLLLVICWLGCTMLCVLSKHKPLQVHKNTVLTLRIEHETMLWPSPFENYFDFGSFHLWISKYRFLFVRSSSFSEALDLWRQLSLDKTLKLSNSFQNLSPLVIFPAYKACRYCIVTARELLHCKPFRRVTSEKDRSASGLALMLCHQ